MDHSKKISLHIPGGDTGLQPILYNYQENFPFFILHKLRWFLNGNISFFLPILNFLGLKFTIVNRLGAPGDTLITANVIKCLKKQFPRLRINCITPYKELLDFDPNINSINQQETFFSADSSYIDLARSKVKDVNVVEYILTNLGGKDFEYKGQYIISARETEWAKKKLLAINTQKPILAICTRSKESVKNWPKGNWIKLIEKIKAKFYIIQLGDSAEPYYDNVNRFAGYLSMRESASILSLSDFFIGPDSLLMHLANALSIPSTIIFGGSRPVNALGYSQNKNLSTSPACGPCWIHDEERTCPYNIQCMDEISVDAVIQTIEPRTKF